MLMLTKEQTRRRVRRTRTRFKLLVGGGGWVGMELEEKLKERLVDVKVFCVGRPLATVYLFRGTGPPTTASKLV